MQQRYRLEDEGRVQRRSRAGTDHAKFVLVPTGTGFMSIADHHCTFCDLIHGAGEVSICYEDAEAIAFMDIQPVNAGHVLVVPRRHY
ncbi:MAG: HIT domain-containing protein, partial [Gemmatimonadaceae bacterium]